MIKSTELFFERMLKHIDFNGNSQWFGDGDELFRWIYKENEFTRSNDKLPAMIFLDIGLPKTSGKNVLRKLRSEPRFETIPVIILSGSNSDRDFRECIQLGANGYLIKTSDTANFKKACCAVIESWSYASRQVFV